MSERDTCRVLKSGSRVEIKVKGSRFIAEAFPVETVASAEARIAGVRKRAYNATHHCSAYRVGTGGEHFRYNDDGEPSGSAGPPILRQIDARELTNTLVVVTRYFGGTKLGVGGLARAYGAAASEALDASVIEERILRVPVRLRFAYADTSPAMHTIERFHAEIMETHYGEATELVVGVRRSEAQAFVEAFTEALAGRGSASAAPGETEG